MKIKKNKINFKNEYKKSWDFIKESKNFILVAFLIFSFFVLIGLFIPTPEPLKEEIFRFIQKIIEKTKDMSVRELVIFILLNNIQVSFFGIILGILFGIIPIFLAMLNGYILGFVFSFNKNFLNILRILPYGIFELPAVFISLGLGIKIGFSILQKRKSELREYLINSLRVFVFFVIPLLVIAAIIEGILINYF